MLDNLKPATGSTGSKKRVGRGQGSGMGKTSARGQKGAKSRTGYKSKRGFEGGQQRLFTRLPKIGFTSRFKKPFAISVERFPAVKELKEITLASLVEAGLAPKSAVKAKLIGTGAKDLASKIKDENVTTSGK